MRPTGISMATKGVIGSYIINQVILGGGADVGGGEGDQDGTSDEEKTDQEEFRPKIIVTKMSISEDRIRMSKDNITVTGVKIIVD